jgi:hypothetical protein
LGELIQIDGSQHWWFETRGPRCTLLAYIDDATSRLMHAAFVPSESTLDYLRETQRYVAVHGRPIAFYSDKHAIFRVSNTEARGGDGMTQFGRALHELNIDIICANSAPAKGRVERSFGTLQDRLIKEMRLAGIASLEAANAFLPGFIAGYNERFGKEPIDARDAHRPVPFDIFLDDVFAWREERTVTHNLTLQYDKIVFLLEPNEVTRPLARQRVTVFDSVCGPPDGDHSGRPHGRHQAPGASAGASVCRAWCGRLASPGPWTTLQSWAGAACAPDGHRLRLGELPGLWTDPGEPDASGTAWSEGLARDAAPMDA